jgi:hypothetical protein
MASNTELAGGGDSEERRSGSVVGLIATANNGDALARSVLRARQHGFDVMVISVDGTEAESSGFARQLGVPVVEPTGSDLDTDALHHELAAAARERGYGTYVPQTQACPRLDYEATAERIAEGKFVVEPLTERTSERPEVIVGIPAYDEAATVDGVVDAAIQEADRVIVVDDGSTDGTAERARAAGATVIEHDRNRGYGAALQTLFEAAAERDPDHLVVMDGDGQHAAEDVPLLTGVQQESDAEVVIGSRFHDEAVDEIPLYRRLGLRVVNALTNLSLGTLTARERVTDTQSGFRAYDSDAVVSLADADLGDGMDASTDILYHATDRGYDIEEVETSVTYDVADANSHHPLRHGLTLVHSILTTVEQRHPVLLLGVPGVVSITLGLAAGSLALGGSPSGGLPFAATALVLGGVVSCFTAIILHALQRQR